MIASSAPRFRALLGCLILVLSGFLQAQEPPAESSDGTDANAETARKIIELHLQARGGRDAIEALEVLRRRGSFQEGKLEYSVEWSWSRDHGTREDRRRDHLGREHHETRVQHGNELWTRKLSPERTRPQELNGVAAREFATDRQLAIAPWEPLLAPTEAGNTFTYLGPKTFRKRPCYFIRGEHPGERTVYYAFDQETFLLIALQYEAPFAGHAIRVTALVRGAERIDGALLETGYDFYQETQLFAQVRFSRSTNEVALAPEIFLKPRIVQRELGRSGD